MNFVFTKGDSIYIHSEEALKSAINNNKIEKYNKLPLLKVGDFVICCEREEGLDPHNNLRSYSSSSWRKGKMFVVGTVVVHRGIYYVCGNSAKGGVYVSGIRYATDEEIENYKKINNLV